MSCKHYEVQVVMAAEGELSSGEETALRAHLGTCESCRSLARDLGARQIDLAGLAPPDPGDAFFNAARERIWREHHETSLAPKTLGARIRGWWAGLGDRFAMNRRALAGFAAVATAAAVLAVVLWPRTVPPTRRLPSRSVATAPSAAGSVDPAEDLLARELGSLSSEDLKAVSLRVLVDAGNGAEYEEDEEADGESLRGEVDSLDSEELGALDAELSRELSDSKGA